MNSALEEFFLKRNVDINDFKMKVDTSLIDYDSYDYNIANNFVPQDEEQIMVPISQMIGYALFHMKDENTVNRDILSNFKNFFDNSEKADSYHQRGLTMLEIPSETIMKTFSYSFTQEPIKTRQIKDKYFIDNNGLHRFTVLKLNYLIELYQGKNKDELDKKYLVPVKNTRIDEIKTCCKILIRNIDGGYSVISHLDNYKLTGKAKVSKAGNDYIMDDNQLINFTIKMIDNLKEKNYASYVGFLSKLGKYGFENGDTDTTLYKIISKHLPNLLKDLNDGYNLGGVKK